MGHICLVFKREKCILNSLVWGIRDNSFFILNWTVYFVCFKIYRTSYFQTSATSRILKFTIWRVLSNSMKKNKRPMEWSTQIILKKTVDFHWSKSFRSYNCVGFSRGLVLKCDLTYMSCIVSREIKISLFLLLFFNKAIFFFSKMFGRFIIWCNIFSCNVTKWPLFFYHKSYIYTYIFIYLYGKHFIKTIYTHTYEKYYSGQNAHLILGTT